MRTYLDWNATAPLRPEARAAMLGAMDALGNPSSVHTEGRAARGIVETARAQVAALVGCDPADLVFTSGATEAAALVLAGRPQVWGAEVEHDAVTAWVTDILPVSRHGIVDPGAATGGVVCLQRANSETGVLQDRIADVADLTQALGKVAAPLARFNLLAGHKFGGPKGVGALVLGPGVSLPALLRGGGQEQGRRAGTENVIGIAGFGAAALAAARDLAADAWAPVAALRDRLEARLSDAAPDLIIPGREAPRLPNTSCLAVPGWRGETQVVQMDLAGFAISAGSACSSGKTRPSRVLRAMGYDEITAASAIRVSLGPTTTQAEIDAFADTWITHYRRRAVRATKESRHERA